MALVHRGSDPAGSAPTIGTMPFQFYTAPPHPIPKARYRVRNWPDYEAGLRRRGDLTLWIDEAALNMWQAPRRNTPGGQATYSDLAIEMVLMLRTVFHLAYARLRPLPAACFAYWVSISAFLI